MRVAHIAPPLKLWRGGMERVAAEISRHLSRFCDESLLLSSETPRDLCKDIRCIGLRPPLSEREPIQTYSYLLLNRGILRWVLKRYKPDVIIAHGPLVLQSLLIPSSLSWIGVVHGTYSSEIRWMRHHPLRGAERISYITSIALTYKRDMSLYKAVANVKGASLVAVSETTAMELVEYGIRRDRIFVILNGIDKNRFKPLKKDLSRSLLEKKLGVRIKGSLITSLGVSPRKGTHILIKSLAYLRKLKKEFTALIGGKPRRKGYLAHLIKLTKMYKLEGSVHMVGKVEEDLLPSFYSASDLVVLPSYNEGAPLTVAEALSCGTPVIATNVGGSADYLRLAGIPELVMPITKYDFSKDLAIKTAEVLEKTESGEIKVMHENIPSLNEMIQKYIDLIEKIHF